MRRFRLHRREDETGISGTGLVAEGIQFSDGTVALHWCTMNRPVSTVLWSSIQDAIEVHGHNGLTNVMWLDD